jgi:hypothetical protein
MTARRFQMKAEFTAVFQKVQEGYVAFVEELPGANTQGSTLEEARENLEEAVAWCWKPIGRWPKRTWPAPR